MARVLDTSFCHELNQQSRSRNKIGRPVARLPPCRFLQFFLFLFCPFACKKHRQINSVGRLLCNVFARMRAPVFYCTVRSASSDLRRRTCRCTPCRKQLCIPGSFRLKKEQLLQRRFSKTETEIPRNRSTAKSCYEIAIRRAPPVLRRNRMARMNWPMLIRARYLLFLDGHA